MTRAPLLMTADSAVDVSQGRVCLAAADGYQAWIWRSNVVAGRLVWKMSGHGVVNYGHATGFRHALDLVQDELAARRGALAGAIEEPAPPEAA